MTSNTELIETLSRSTIYREFERAFSETTGLPVSLRPVESWNLPNHGKKYENPFCRLMAARSASCASCLRVQEKLAQCARDTAQTVVCDAGLCDSAVPVKVGNNLIGFLQTGQIFRKAPTAEQFAKLAKRLDALGIPVDAEIESAYFNTRVLEPQRYAQMIKMLSIFADHLAIVCNEIVVRQENAEPPLVSRAKAFIAEHQGEDLTLAEVARHVHTSIFHFCKIFKKATKLTFTEYLARVRIEKAKNLLLNPNLRISEIAYEVGFQSLTHFNRIFKKLGGDSPTTYRLHAAGVN